MTQDSGKPSDPTQAQQGKSPRASQTEQDSAGSKHEAPTAVQPVEPEQTNLTGAGKAQQREHLQENVEGDAGQGQRHPDLPQASTRPARSLGPEKTIAKPRWLVFGHRFSIGDGIVLQCVLGVEHRCVFGCFGER